MKKILVNEKYNGKKLSTFLLDSFDGLSLNTIFKALRKKDIRINDVRVNDNIILHKNDIVTIFITDEFLYKNINLDIVYEDENILVVNKETGIEVINSDNCLTNLIIKNYNNLSMNFPYPCHRLDRNTSGLVLFAKNETSLSIILDKFKKQEIEKYYLCTVYGIPNKSNDILKAYLFKDNKKSQVYISDVPKKGYLEITTSYKLISKNIKENTSILEIQLHTGRTHQIRAHLAHIGLPIIGDR